VVKSRIKFNIVLIFLVLSVFLVSGQQGCPQGGPGQVGQAGQTRSTSTQSGSLGLDFSFVEGFEYLTQGKKVSSRDFISVNIIIENSGKTPKSGLLCIRDDVEDVYGGVVSECKSFRVNGAVYDQDKFVQTSTENILFGPYKYEEFPLSRNVNVVASLQYSEQLIQSTTVSVPEPSIERLSVESDPSPIVVSIDKTVSPREDGYRVSLGIELRKSSGELKVTTPDFKKEGLILDPKLSFTNLDCEYSDPTIKFVEFKQKQSTNLIRCSALLPREEITYPLLLSLHYGVEVDKKFSFNLEKEEKSP